MVYTKVIIAAGIVLTLQEAQELLVDEGLAYFDDSENKTWLTASDDFPKDLKIYHPQFHRTTPTQNHGYLIGVERGFVHRKLVDKCGNCGKYTYCDKCMGQTSGGFFDVEFIAKHSFVQVDAQRICCNCQSPIPKSMTKKKNFKCLVCNAVQTEYTIPVLEKAYGIIKNLAEALPSFSEEDIKKRINYYLYIDDCLCCT